MKVIGYTEFGGPEVLRHLEVMHASHFNAAPLQDLGAVKTSIKGRAADRF